MGGFTSNQGQNDPKPIPHIGLSSNTVRQFFWYFSVCLSVTSLLFVQNWTP